MSAKNDLHTDYDRLAQTYDQGELRHRVEADAALSALIKRRGARHCVRALDIACGTGLYLHAQEQAHPVTPGLAGTGSQRGYVDCTSSPPRS